MTPYLADHDTTIYLGDSRDVLYELPERSVHACITSPPFLGLRDYGVAGQIGMEDTVYEWVESLAQVFRGVHRVLRDDGTLWVEVGDVYIDKQLIGAPWRLALALREAGWIVRSEIVWEKPNGMPESTQNRPTRNHSTVFMFAKQHTYYYDPEPLRTPHKHDGRKKTTVRGGAGSAQHRDGERWPGAGANARSVWSVPSGATSFQHFAAMPPELCRRMIVTATSESGCCPTCGAQWQRQVERDSYYRHMDGSEPDRKYAAVQPGLKGRGPRKDFGASLITHVGWQPGCACPDPSSIPAVVLDPFAGSGTTAVVAREQGRHSILVELNEDYCKIAADRLAQQSLLA